MSLDLAQNDTICALATPRGVSALALVKVCGKDVQTIAKKIFSKTLNPFMATHGQLKDSFGNVIDDVICIFYPKEKSFVGQDTLEINCHGNPLIVDEIINALKKYQVRLARPGEFSLRAVLNKKIDLSQAEGILDLIHAKSEVAKNTALKVLRGGLSKKCAPIYDCMVEVLAHIEARMDFVEDDLGGYDKNFLVKKLESALDMLKDLLKNSDYAVKLHEGVRIVICGLPNAGKSTLLNTLSKEEKAIVHEKAGTTRDVIEANILIDGIPVSIIDVAGIRDLSLAEDIEQIGIKKAFTELERADLVIWLSDATMETPFEDETIKSFLSNYAKPVLKVLNKIELVTINEQSADMLYISAKEKINIDVLLNQLSKRLVKENLSLDEIYVTKTRQKEELLDCLSSLNLALDALKQSLIDEIISSELRNAGFALERLLGTKFSEDILDKIFSEFCIGK